MIKRGQLVFVSVFILLACAFASAQSSGGNYQLTQSVIPGGGGASTDGAQQRLEGTIGQSVVGTSTGGNYTLDGGFVTGFAPVVNGPSSISGQVTLASNGSPLANVTITLTKPDTTTATATTDASGNYTFSNLPDGSYTVTPSKTNYSFTPASQPVTLNGASATGINFSATSTATASGANGTLLISEFRMQGPAPSSPAPGNTNGELDEFIELYNNTNAAVDISGYAIDTSAGFTITLPAGATIPARGHYLVANAGGYSLTAHAAPDFAYSGLDLQPNTGLALLNAAHGVVDAVGFATTPAPYREGNGLADVTGAGQYSFVRNLSSGVARDTGDNRADFVFIATDAGAYGRAGAVGAADGPAVLGMPGPESTQSTMPNGSVKSSLINPGVDSSTSPNRVRDSGAYTDTLTPSAPDGVLAPTQTPYAHGTLSIQRRFANNTGGMISKLRFRVVDVTTLGSPGSSASQADLRLLTSDGTVRQTGGSVVVTVTGLTLEQAAAQSRGGGVNSTVASAVISLATPLSPGAFIDVQFLLGVQQTGNLRFFVIIEAAP